MTCEPIRFPGGGGGFACSRGNQARGGGRCYICDKPSTKLCDAPVEQGRTCDRNICDRHATRVGPNLDVCPAHKP